MSLAWGAYGDFMTTTFAAVAEHLSATLGLHAFTEAVCSMAALLAWLICAFHFRNLKIGPVL
jgi:hypothetical protein